MGVYATPNPLASRLYLKAAYVVCKAWVTSKGRETLLMLQQRVHQLRIALHPARTLQRDYKHL